MRAPRTAADADSLFLVLVGDTPSDYDNWRASAGPERFASVEQINAIIDEALLSLNQQERALLSLRHGIGIMSQRHSYRQIGLAYSTGPSWATRRIEQIHRRLKPIVRQAIRRVENQAS